jgi:beta-lactamase class A
VAVALVAAGGGTIAAVHAARDGGSSGTGAAADRTTSARAAAHTASPTRTASPSASPTPTPSASPTHKAVNWTSVLRSGQSGVAPAAGASYSVAVRDTSSGAHASYGTGSYDTASIVKVDILATLLLRAQDAKRTLTASERSEATVMIERSDNTAATELYVDIGEAAGLNAANKRFGLTSTSGGAGELWGLTQTTAADQLRLLGAVFGGKGTPSSPLDSASRDYIVSLMGQVETDQRWGVPAASDTGGFAVKNGWLQRTTTGRWDINSVGRISYGGRTYLVAVTSHGNATESGGIALVERAAKAAVRSFAAATKSAG